MTCELLSAVLEAKEEQCGGDWEKTFTSEDIHILHVGSSLLRAWTAKLQFHYKLESKSIFTKESFLCFKDLCVRNNPLKSIKFIFPDLMTVSWSNKQETQSIQFYVLAQYSVHILMGTTIIRKIHNKVSLTPVISQYICILTVTQ